MKKLVIVSDTHGNLKNLEKLLPIIEESDLIIHLGDYSSDLKVLSPELYDKLYYVKGNCDGGGEDAFFEAENLKIMMTHGDRYGVKQSLTKLYLKAKEMKIDVVLYGHTHIPKIEEYDGITFINPGCMSIFSNKTYCYAVVNNDKIIAKIVDIK